MTPTQQGVVSSCCSASIYENTDVCINCGDHTSFEWIKDNK